ncbi:helix-turn-helix transcriptional regulator [Pontiella sulfatireligans]|uniref:Melibiose operon regulatory protein n=1 Tax=Pontiella sulfatireligans TaxID=2750658 RepID=A0A6C2UDQ2_9BACT|nr:AraC family transcriptional regulator [Pontiella sulfatireligans]VGO18019.1 Melibiose operon regulatory protein [Pontiella sulfatireligans]
MEPINSIENSGRYQWKNISEDPLFSRISAHVFCAYRSELGKEWVRGFARNPYDRLYFVESGTAVIATPEQVFHLQKGCCYLIASNLLHRHACTSKVVIHWCHFQTLLDGASDLFQEIVIPMEACPAGRSAYLETFHSLEKTMDCHEPWCHLQRTSLLLQLIQPHLKTAKPPTSKAMEGRRRFFPVLKHIDEHLDETILVEDLARLMGLNKEYFSRFFHRHFHIPPKKYILQKRIQHAQKLLCHTGLQAQEIALRCGFNDPYHFSKSFKNVAGIPPSEYRRLYLQQGM